MRRPIIAIVIAGALAVGLTGCVTVIVPPQSGGEQKPAPTVTVPVEEQPAAPVFDPAVSSAACAGATATTTVDDGAPGVNYYTLLQCFAWAYGGYEGPIDGFPDAAAWTGIQSAAQSYGYTGPLDGSLANGNAIQALQMLARIRGYTGPVDGDPGPNTYRFSAALFNDALAGGWNPSINFGE